MLTKRAYSKVIQGLRNIKASWLEDRRDNPNTVPYEIDCQLRHLIERAAREDHMNVGGSKNMEALCNQTIKYLIDKGHIIGSPYGGVMFPLPEDHAPLPSKQQLIEQTLRSIQGND